MSARTPSRLTEPIFDAVLTPYRSLSTRGFGLVMAVLGGLSLAIGTAFLLRGAWPVMGFFGLDVLLVYLAFRASYRSARAYEAVRVTRDHLTVRRVTPGGRAETWAFDPAVLRVDLEEPEAHHCRLAIRSRGRRLVIGRFLAPEERVALAGALSSAVAAARRPLGAA